MMHKIMPVVIPLLLSEKLSGKISQTVQSLPMTRWISTVRTSGYPGDICHRHHVQHDSRDPLNLLQRNMYFPQRTKRPDTETEHWTLYSAVVFNALSFTSAFVYAFTDCCLDKGGSETPRLATTMLTSHTTKRMAE
jgi:hypothetical protein